MSFCWLCHRLIVFFIFLSSVHLGADVDCFHVETLPTRGSRFRAPQPVAPWTEPLDATAYGDACPQMDHSLAPLVPISEDCLTLNLFVPGGAWKNTWVWGEHF
jgi:hypothetical protein